MQLICRLGRYYCGKSWVSYDAANASKRKGLQPTLSRLPSGSIIDLFGQNQQKAKSGLCRHFLTTDHALVCDQAHSHRSGFLSVSADSCRCSFNTFSSRCTTFISHLNASIEPLGPLSIRNCRCHRFSRGLSQIHWTVRRNKGQGWGMG